MQARPHFHWSLGIGATNLPSGGTRNGISDKSVYCLLQTTVQFQSRPSAVLLVLKHTLGGSFGAGSWKLGIDNCSRPIPQAGLGFVSEPVVPRFEKDILTYS